MKLKPKLMMKPKTLIMICRQLNISLNQLLNPQLYSIPQQEAINEFKKGNITEGQLSKILGINRLQARQIVQENQLLGE